MDRWRFAAEAHRIAIDPLRVRGRGRHRPVAWHEARALGRLRYDREWIESTPVFAGLLVMIGYTIGGDLMTPVVAFGDVSGWAVRGWVLTSTIMSGSVTIVGLAVLEHVLTVYGLLDHEWRLLGDYGENIRKEVTDE